MSKAKNFTSMSLVILLILSIFAVGTAFAGERASFDNPQIRVCNLNSLTISGTLTIGAPVIVEEYLNDELRNTFRGAAGRYSGYATRFDAPAYPYTFKAVLSFKDGETLVEQYEVVGDCTAENTGTVSFNEVELDAIFKIG